LAEDGAVIASFDKRRAEIGRQLQAAAAALGAQPVDDDALLDEVTGLVERPTVMVCSFDAEFLQVPQECLILTMKANQKYFPLLDATGKLSNRFLIVSNINPQDPSAVIGGNERVVRPRLADAQFFFNQDRKRTLESRVDGLSKVVYHNQLGTQGERMQRVCAIAKGMATALAASGLAPYATDAGAFVAHAVRAARLAKTDLMTDMVGEFPELQGTMGRYYALNDGEDVLVAARAMATDAGASPLVPWSVLRGNGGNLVEFQGTQQAVVEGASRPCVRLWDRWLRLVPEVVLPPPVGGLPDPVPVPVANQRCTLSIGAWERRCGFPIDWEADLRLCLPAVALELRDLHDRVCPWVSEAPAPAGAGSGDPRPRGLPSSRIERALLIFPQGHA
jgi:hypothetical protein